MCIFTNQRNHQALNQISLSKGQQYMTHALTSDAKSHPKYVHEYIDILHFTECLSDDRFSKLTFGALLSIILLVKLSVRQNTTVYSLFKCQIQWVNVKTSQSLQRIHSHNAEQYLISANVSQTTLNRTTVELIMQSHQEPERRGSFFDPN